MKKLYFLFLLFFTLVAFGQKNPKTIGFIENRGQIVDQDGRENKSVLYLLNTNGLNVQLKKNGFSYDIYETKKVPLTKKEKELQASLVKTENKITAPEFSLEYTYHRIDIDFLNSNPNVHLETEEKSTDYDNYYNVAHAPQGITNVHKFQKVTYQNIYNQIDVVFFIPKDSTKSVEYNFVVKPGGKVSDIQMQFKGAKTGLTDNKIKMNVRFGEMEETLPLSWEEHKGERKEIAVDYRKIKEDVYGFAGDLNVSGKTIVIDPTPVRLWGTYYGNEINIHWTLGDASLATDPLGNAYMAGTTVASNSAYATSGAHQSSIPQGPYLNSNGIIVKFDSNGNRLWGTYYGGTGLNEITDVKTDSQNNVILCGVTQAATNISTNGAHKPNLTDQHDAFLVKFNASGVRIWGTYFGGEGYDKASAVGIDSSDNIYIVGTTWSLTGIAFNCNFQSQLFAGPQYNVDAFIARFNGSGILLWATYAGGENRDEFETIVIKGNYLVAAGTSDSFNNISTSGVFQQIHDNHGHRDGILYKFSTNGNRLWATYYGGEQVDDIFAVEVDDEDTIYFGGETASMNNIATPSSFGSSNQSLYSGYFAKLNSNGSRIWGSYLGEATVYSIVFKNNSIYIGATGDSIIINNNLTTPCAYREENGHSEGYIGKFSKSGQLIWGTFVGGWSTFEKTSIAFDRNNDIFVSGITMQSNTGITDSNSYQQTVLGVFSNYFIMKFHEDALCSMNFQPTGDSPICTSKTISFYNIPSGYVYNWTGPNGFTSNIQNPTISNATPANSGLYTLIISDAIICSCQKTYTFTIVVEDNLKPIPDISNLPNINGDCNTVVTAPTAIDNCAGLIHGTTTDPLNYTIPGTYTIHWNYNDGNGNTSTQNQQVVVSTTQLPILNPNFYYCIGETPALTDIAITGQNIQWYDALTGGNLLASTTLLQDGVTYYASQAVNGCESLRVSVKSNVQNTPAPTGTDQSLCATQNPTVATIVVTGTSIKWYATSVSTIALPTTTLLVNGTTYYATQTVNGCESVNKLPITITLINTLNAHDYSIEICDDKNDKKETVILTSYNDDLIAAVTGCTFAYYHSFAGATDQVAGDRITDVNYILVIGLHTVYVRITSGNGCHQIVALHLTLLGKPVIPITDIMPICEGSSITVDAGSGYDYYLWSTGETGSSITVSTSGNYSVVVRENHTLIPYCESIKDFTVVKSNMATVLKVVTSDWTINQNSITVLLTGTSVGDYEYSLDGIHYQDSNTFTGLESGEYTVYVKDKNGCGIQPEDFYLLMYPKFFTPNGDGFNDVWKIELSEKEANLKVKIFDRFGKLLKALDNTMGWNGTFNGQELPSTDYWFTVIRADGKEYRGHFALKR